MPPLETIGEASAVIVAVGTGILGWLKSNSSKKGCRYSQRTG